MKDYPLVKYVILFILGIILQKYIGINSILFVLVLSILILFFLLSRKYLNSFQFLLIIYSVFIYIAVIFAGVVTAEINQPSDNFIPGGIYSINNCTFYGEICRINLIKNGELEFEVSADSIKKSEVSASTKVKLLVKIRDGTARLKTLYNKIIPGNYISVGGTYRKAAEKRNPGEFDYNKYLRSKGISGIVYTYHTSNIKILNYNESIISNIIFQSRKAVDKRLTFLYNNETAGLLRGLILADRSEIPYETKEDFINSGVVHVLAVSGLHVGFIAFIFLILFGRFNIYFRMIFTLIGILCFMFLTGIPPSVFRASVMAIVIIISQLTNRTTNLINSLALAALIILLIFPNDLFNPGFQLSFSAVLSIAVIYPIFQKKIQSKKSLNKPAGYLALFFSLTLSAQLGTLPLTMYYFGKVSIISLVANLLIIPMIGVIISIGIATILIGSISTAIAHYFAVSNELLTRLLFSITHATGNFSFSILKVSQFTLLDIIIFFAFMIFAIYFFNKFRRQYAKVILILLTILNIYLFVNINSNELMPPGVLSILMIDVGQGDAILIKFPKGETALIDAGDASQYFDNGSRTIYPLLNFLGIDKINYGFVTHLDKDHYGGFYSLIKLHMIEKIFKPALDTTLEKDKRFENFLNEYNISTSYYDNNSIKIEGASLYVLNNHIRFVSFIAPL